jgi:hypothetical protein
MIKLLPTMKRQQVTTMIETKESSLKKIFLIRKSKFIIKVVTILLFIISCSLAGYSQQRVTELWTGIEFDLPITKKIEFEIEPELRYADNMKTFDWFITNLSLSYTFNKEFKTALSYDYRSGKDKWQHVMEGNFYFDEKLFKIKLDYRLRYQKKIKYKFEWNNEGERRTEDSYEDHIRNRIILEYDTDEWIKPFIGAEIYYLFDHLGYQSKEKVDGNKIIVRDRYTDRFDVFRFYLGLNMDTFKEQGISVYWRYEQEFNIEDPKISNVLGISYAIDLPRLF